MFWLFGGRSRQDVPQDNFVVPNSQEERLKQLAELLLEHGNASHDRDDDDYSPRIVMDMMVLPSESEIRRGRRIEMLWEAAKSITLLSCFHFPSSTKGGRAILKQSGLLINLTFSEELTPNELLHWVLHPESRFPLGCRDMIGNLALQALMAPFRQAMSSLDDLFLDLSDDVPAKRKVPDIPEPLKAALFDATKEMLLHPRPYRYHQHAIGDFTRMFSESQREQLRHIALNNNCNAFGDPMEELSTSLQQQDAPLETRQKTIKTLRRLAMWQGRYERPNQNALKHLASSRQEEDVPLIEAWARGTRALQRFVAQQFVGERLRVPEEEGKQRERSGILEPTSLSVVFSFLDPVSLAVASAVCSAWRVVALQDSLWKPLWDDALALVPAEVQQVRLVARLEKAGAGKVAETFRLARGERYVLLHHKGVLMNMQSVCYSFFLSFFLSSSFLFLFFLFLLLSPLSLFSFSFLGFSLLSLSLFSSLFLFSLSLSLLSFFSLSLLSCLFLSVSLSSHLFFLSPPSLLFPRS